MPVELRTSATYIVTGGGGAVAGVIGEVFREAGARVALAGRNGPAVHAQSAALGVLPLVADLTAPAEARRMVDEARSAFGRVDGLIHAAGGFDMAPVTSADEAQYDRMFGMNMRTLFSATRAVLPGLLEQGDGFIAGFSAGPVWMGSGGARMALYVAAKAAVSMYLRALEAEVRDRGVRVAVVYPLGAIDTARNRRDMPGEDWATWIDARELATTLLFACTRGPRGRLLELPISAGA